MTQVVKISKPTKNVLTAAPEDLYLDTNTPLLKVYAAAAGAVIFGALDTVKTTTINHSLGYTPSFMLRMQQVSAGPRVPVLGIDSLDVGDSITNHCSMNTTALTITSTSQVANPAGTYNYYYYIFYDQQA